MLNHGPIYKNIGPFGKHLKFITITWRKTNIWSPFIRYYEFRRIEFIVFFRRPQLFKPQPRYTQVVFNLPPQVPLPVNNAQSFVNSYIPINPKPIQASTNYFESAKILSSQSLPGFGLKYFVPEYINNVRKEQQRQEDAKHNVVESNDVNGGSRDSSSDLQWQYEKDLTRRLINLKQEVSNPTIKYKNYSY